MKEIDATRLKLKAMKLVEGTDLKWWNCIRDSLMKIVYSDEPCFDDRQKDYELALGIVEGKPAWEGDKLYSKATGISHEISVLLRNPQDWSWLPPKQKTAKVVVVSDAAQIEARILAWLAGQADVVEAFAQSRRVYSKRCLPQNTGEHEMNYPDLAYYENLRDQLITDKYRAKLNEVLTDIKAFETLDADYEFLNLNSGQIARALRNLDDAIAGKEYARDAVFTALHYVLDSIKTICKEEAESDTLGAEEMKLNRKKFGDE